MTTKQDLSAHVALVTGGSRGIGAAVAIALAELGAAVAVNYRERAADAEAVVARIKAGGGRAIAVAADGSNRSETRSGRSTFSSTTPESRLCAASTISPKMISIGPLWST
jgi:NAD(P)-dependent dehydrogenase (short-subunit alcohol dehydrogenase family)